MLLQSHGLFWAWFHNFLKLQVEEPLDPKVEADFGVNRKREE